MLDPDSLALVSTLSSFATLSDDRLAIGLLISEDLHAGNPI